MWIFFFFFFSHFILRYCVVITTHQAITASLITSVELKYLLKWCVSKQYSNQKECKSHLISRIAFFSQLIFNFDGTSGMREDFLPIVLECDWWRSEPRANQSPGLALCMLNETGSALCDSVLKLSHLSFFAVFLGGYSFVVAL